MILSVIVTAGAPATEAATLAELAVAGGWDVHVIASPSALDFIDAAAIEAVTGHPVRTGYRKPGEPRSPMPDAIVVAPATFNTINKWALGITDTYALGVLAEATGMGTPIVVLPFVNSALASRAPFREAVRSLRSEGVTILLGQDGVEPGPPRSGDDAAASFPWRIVLEYATRAVQ
jgi:phosphopantothenoylcysteine synthetase/decarboxylase